MAGTEQISVIGAVAASQSAVEIHAEIVANFELACSRLRQEQNPSQRTTRPLNTNTHLLPLLICYKVSIFAFCRNLLSRAARNWFVFLSLRSFRI